MYAFGSAEADRAFGMEWIGIMLTALFVAWAWGRFDDWRKARRLIRAIRGKEGGRYGSSD